MAKKKKLVTQFVPDGVPIIPAVNGSSVFYRASGGGDDESSSSSSEGPSTKTIADVTQSGGATTTLTTGTISLTEGTPYFFSICRYNGNTQNSANFYMNGDTTTSNYSYAGIQRNSATGFQGFEADSQVLIRTTANNPFTYQGICGLQNSIPYIVGNASLQDSNNRGRLVGGYNKSESTFTELQYTSGANMTLNDSYIKIWEILDTPVVDLSVSGSSVTTLSSGAINLTEGTSHIFALGITPDSSGGNIRMLINGDSTTGNYRRGTMRSYGGANNGYNVPTFTPDADKFVVAYGNLGLLDSIPYINITYIQYTTNGRLKNSAIWHTSESSFTELSLVSETAAQIASGSYLKVWEVG